MIARRQVDCSDEIGIRKRDNRSRGILQGPFHVSSVPLDVQPRMALGVRNRNAEEIAMRAPTCKVGNECNQLLKVSSDNSLENST